MPLKKRLKLTLSQCFGLPTAPNGSLGWHNFLSNELPLSTITQVAAAAGLAEKHLWDLFQIEKPKTAKTQAKPMTAEQADVLYRLSKSSMYLATKLDSCEDAAKWWVTPVASLGNSMPLSLLRTTPGYELVTVLIERIEAKNQKPANDIYNIDIPEQEPMDPEKDPLFR